MAIVHHIARLAKQGGIILTCAFLKLSLQIRMGNRSAFSNIDLFQPLETVAAVDISYHIVRILEGLLALTGNIIIVLAFYKSHPLYRTTIILMYSLALSDMLSICSTVFDVIFDFSVIKHEIIWSITCLVYKIITFTILFTSFFSVTLLTIERMISVCFHSKYKKLITIPRTKCACIMIWILVFLFYSIPISLQHYKLNLSTEYGCVRSPFIIVPMGFAYILFMAPNLLLMITVIICNTKIALFVQQFSRRVHSENSSKSKFLKRQAQVSKMLMIVTLLVILSYLPIIFFGVITSKIDIGASNRLIFHRISTILVYSNSTFNPLIYYVRNGAIRKACKKLFTRKVEQLQNSKSHTSRTIGSLHI